MESQRKKILYCITKANWGGAQKYVYDLATSLNPDLYEVIVLAGGGGALTERLQSKNIRTIILDSLNRDVSIWKDCVAFFKILRVFKQEKPDIVHLNSSKIGLLGALAARLVNFFSYLTPHHLHLKPIFTGHGWAFNEERSKWQKKVIYYLHHLTIALAHKTIAVSEQTKEQILKGEKDNGKMVVIRNGIEGISFLDRETAREKISEKLPVDLDWKNKIWLGTISELHKNKGLKYLIEAIHLLNLELEDKSKLPVVIIIGEGERREKLQARINRYSLQNNIFMIGRVEEAEKYLNAFDIFTLTSITEALPYVILEAGLAGLPIIASGVGGIPEIINNMENGILVEPRDTEQIKKAISLLLENSEKRNHLGQNLQRKIQEHFNKATMVRKTVELYN